MRTWASLRLLTPSRVVWNASHVTGMGPGADLHQMQAPEVTSSG